MNDKVALQMEAVQLRNLLMLASNDPILTPQIQSRLAGIEKALQSSSESQFARSPVRAAIFLKGYGIDGSAGIRPSLAGELLIQYERMYVQQALHDERVIAKNAGRNRRPRGATTPELLFTGTPRGSFGLEFEPNEKAGDSMVDVHAESLKKVADAIAGISDSSDVNGSLVIQNTPPAVLAPLKKFIKAIAHSGGAELRLAFSDAPPKNIEFSAIQLAAERLDREIVEDVSYFVGTFRGLAPDSGVFDFRLDDGTLISGALDDELTDVQLAEMLNYSNRRCVATVLSTSVIVVGGTSRVSYTLLSISGERDGGGTGRSRGITL